MVGAASLHGIHCILDAVAAVRLARVGHVDADTYFGAAAELRRVAILG